MENKPKKTKDFEQDLRNALADELCDSLVGDLFEETKKLLTFLINLNCLNI